MSNTLTTDSNNADLIHSFNKILAAQDVKIKALMDRVAELEEVTMSHRGISKLYFDPAKLDSTVNKAVQDFSQTIKEEA